MDPKKLQALVAKKKGNPGEDEEMDEQDEGAEGGEDEESGEKEIHPQEVEKMLADAAREVEEKSDPDLLAQIAGYDPEQDGNPPEWVQDEDIWEAAKDAVEKKWDEYDEPYAVVAHVYKKMGGSIAGGKGDEE